MRRASERVVALVAAQGWDAGSLGRLPPGVALPLREAFQRCRATPPPGEGEQAVVARVLDVTRCNRAGEIGDSAGVLRDVP